MGKPWANMGSLMGCILTTNNHEQLEDDWITMERWRSGEPGAN